MAMDMFIKIDGIEGESKDKAHRNEIEILSFSWGASNPTTIGTSTGGAGAGKVSISSFNFMDHVQKSSPLLFLATARGQAIESAIVSVRKAGASADFYKATLSPVFVESVQHSGSEGGEDDTPTESVSLAFAKIDFEYRQQLPGGAFGEWVKGVWDQAFNKE
jgi:type VI secretion system secreted protein Hcp